MENLKYSEILRYNSLMKKDLITKSPFSIKILSNITCNQLKEVLEYNLLKSGINPDISVGNYDNIIQDSYHCTGNQLVLIHYDLVNILDKLEDFIENYTDEDLDRLTRSIISEINLIFDNLSKIPTVLFDTFSSMGIYSSPLYKSKSSIIASRLNEYIKSKESTNVSILDINITISKLGIFNSFDFRMFYQSKTLYTIQFWKEYVNELSSIVYKYTGKLKKAIIFDCDNTLWKGILGEDGERGIDMSNQSKIGHIYNYVQQISVWLSSQGVIIGLCSKNNLSDVDKIFSEHPDLKLKNDNIVIKKINWQDKASNLREIAQELNIGLDSIVFIDDSPFEINLIKEQIPEILTLQVPEAIHEYPKLLLNLVDKFFYLSGNSLDLRKTLLYQEQIKRIEEKKNHLSIDDYLSSLKIEIKISINDISQISRISQLTQKTNQFNLTTKRYTENEIKSFIESNEYYIYSVFVQDKFGDNGLTGICIAKISNTTEVIIDTFLMSCRIMGRNIENALMDFLIMDFEKKQYNIVHSAYFATPKNSPTKNFYEESGFFVTDTKDDDKKYQLKISEYKMKNIEYIKVNY